MLHVTNGSVFLSRLHDLGVPGAIVPWDDVLHEGPVPAGLSPSELRRCRAEFLAINWGDVADIERGLASRDQAVVDAAAGEEIVLWFEHDLYDQLHVLQVLDLLHGLRAAGRLTARVTAILADDYLAAQPDDLLSQWFASRVVVSEAQFAAAAAAWEAFRAPEPIALQGFRHPGAWPSLHAGAAAAPSAVSRGGHRPLAHGTSDPGGRSQGPTASPRAVPRVEPRVRGRDLHGGCRLVVAHPPAADRCRAAPRGRRRLPGRLASRGLVARRRAGADVSASPAPARACWLVKRITCA